MDREHEAPQFQRQVLRELDQIRGQQKDFGAKLDQFITHELTDLKVKIAQFDPEKFVTREEWKPYQRVIWAVASVFITTIATAIVALILKGHV